FFSCTSHCAKHKKRNVQSSKFLRRARRFREVDTPEMRYSLAIDSLHSSRVGVRNTGTLIILIAYTVYYVLLISRGHGVPYVLDNNETYSALLHAHNLWSFDFFRSFGVADDLASPLEAAHPIIHTQQGNFPPLFAFYVYACGARTAQSQIWITKFT